MRTLKSGRILLGKHAIPCAVRNVSEGGVCLELPSTFGIPKLFDLVVGEKPPRPCKVMWLTEARVGVQFQDVDTPDHPPHLAA